jgi:hypothetical protein
LQQFARVLKQYLVQQVLRQSGAARDAFLEGGCQQVRRLVAVAVDNESRSGRDRDSGYMSVRERVPATRCEFEIDIIAGSELGVGFRQ